MLLNPEGALDKKQKQTPPQTRKNPFQVTDRGNGRIRRELNLEFEEIHKFNADTSSSQGLVKLG